MAEETNIVDDEAITMDVLIAEIKNLITEYGVETSDLTILFAIEQFEIIRNYPLTWDEEKKIADMEKNKAKIAMAAIEIDAKDGAEGQVSHSENGISRTWSDKISAYKDVIGFANCV